MQPIPDGASAPPEPARRRTVALVLNEKAGALLGSDGGGGALRARLDEQGLGSLDIPPGDLSGRLAQARDSGADIIVVAGGDGTVACAAQVLKGSGGTLGIIPLGTMNLLAKDLGIPIGDPGAAVDVVANGVTRGIDVAEIRGAGDEGHIFLCAAMLGSPARLGHHREDGRRRGNGVAGWWHFARAVGRARSRHRAVPFTVRVDGVGYRLRTASLTLTVNALDAGSGNMFGRSRLDGGMLFVYAVRHRSITELVRVVFHMLRGQIADDPAVTVLHGSAVELDSPGAALRVLIDGEEHLLKTPVRARVLEDRLAVMAPAS
jgi:diacylglycerol kinase family enzyme